MQAIFYADVNPKFVNFNMTQLKIQTIKQHVFRYEIDWQTISVFFYNGPDLFFTYIFQNCKSFLSGPLRVDIFYCHLLGLYMSPVSPVFHTAATVSIGLENMFRVEHPF